MRRYLSLGIIALFIVSIIICTIIFIPRMLNDSTDVSDSQIVTPAHWWKANVDDAQIESIKNLWGKDLSAKEFVAEVCPDLLSELPYEGQLKWGNTIFRWPTEDINDFNSEVSVICFSTSSSYEGQNKLFEFFLGFPKSESKTFKHTTKLGLSDENCYRISLYLDKPFDKYEAGR